MKRQQCFIILAWRCYIYIYIYIYTTIKTQLTVVLLLVLRFILLLLLPSMQRYTILISHLSEILVID